LHPTVHGQGVSRVAPRRARDLDLRARRSRRPV